MTKSRPSSAPPTLKRAQTYSKEAQNEILKKFPVVKSYWELIQKTPTTLAEELRFSKAQDFTDVTFAEYFRTATTRDICLYWSDRSEQRLAKALDKASQGHTNIAVFAYGKLGSRELNLSSDVDLIVLAETGAEESATPALREFRALISDNTDMGFCHRIDFDLRAGGRMGPLVATFEQWQDYFANYGEAWERLTFIRFRPIWGSQLLQKQVLDEAERLTFRKYLDFSLIEELKDLRVKIHEQNWMRSQGDIIDLKLGVGGIRDLELFTHTLQVIYGGKSPSVRTPSTSFALEQLEKVGAVTAKDRKFMTEHYWKLRHFENLVQAIGDEQTHLLNPANTSEIFADQALKGLREEMKECHRLVSSLLGPLDNLKRSLPDNEPAQKAWMKSIGLDESIIEQYLPTLFEKEVLSRQRERDDRTRKLFIYRFLTRSQEMGLDLNEILPRLSDLIRRIRAKASLFHMLVNQPTLLDRLCHLLSSSGYLSQILIHRPELLDTIVLGQQNQINDEMDLEAKLIHWRERRMLAVLLSGIDFLNDHDLDRLTSRLSETADTIVSEMMTDLKKEFSSDVDVIALGKWGGQEMGLNSDLDFILISPATPKEGDMKLARRLLNRLTSGEEIYNVDLRLKPHGSAGVLLTSIEELKNFLSNEAPAWQRQSYLKARSLFSTTDIHEILKICSDRGLSPDEIQELARIRNELIQQNRGKKEIKFAAGGLLDIELSTQTQLLAKKLTPPSAQIAEHFKLLQKYCEPSQQIALKTLEENYFFLRKLGQLTRLREQPTLQQRIHSVLALNLEALKTLDPRVSAS